jgi:hypothetical protein
MWTATDMATTKMENKEGLSTVEVLQSYLLTSPPEKQNGTSVNRTSSTDFPETRIVQTYKKI